MGRRPLGLLVAALALVAAASAGPAAPAWAAADPIGAHSMLQLDDPPSFMAAMFAQAAAMHASAIRLDVAPALVFEAQSRPPDFSGLDAVVGLARSYHLQVVADLVTVPSWMAQCATPTSDPTRCATDDLSGYASVIRQIVSRADPVIGDWEVWNEPDTAAFFDGTPQQYASMLRAAHDAIKAVDPADQVLLGGLSGTGATDWLGQALATPGADAAHAFDIANVHERGDLWQLAPDLRSFEQFLAASGFGGPLWVTEHGYPSDPQYQYDPGYMGDPAAQASYLAASIPTLLDAGAAEVFVTERDNLGGQFASEGVLGGDVSDPPPGDPQVVPKPSVAVVQAIADCYEQLGRDCPGAPPAASPSTAIAPAAAPGQTSTATVTVTDPGTTPIVLGQASVTGPDAGELSLPQDGCAGVVLEPRQTCSVSVLFRPVTGGDARADLELTSDDGTLDVPVIAMAPSVSALRSPQLPDAAFTPTGAGDGVGYPQRAILTLTNSVDAAVAIARTTLSGPDARRFHIAADRCARAVLRPRGECRLTVWFAPARPGVARAQLTLDGTGLPLTVQLRPAAFALPAVTRLTAGHARCALRAGQPFSVVTSQPARLRWNLTRASAGGGTACARAARPTGPRVAAGAVRTRRHPTRVDGRIGFTASWRLGGAPLRPGVYVLSVWAVDEHGVGAPRSLRLLVMR